jgi:hypothetical protein
MTVYHPPQRAVGVQVLSVARWIRATFHIPKPLAFDDHLARDRTFFTLTDVALGAGPPLPFLALRGSAAHAVLPDPSEEQHLPPPASGTRPREVSCYLEHVAFHGTLDLRPGIRTSDFLAHQEGFITLRRCRCVPPIPGQAEPAAVVFVNARAVVAVAEEGGRTAPSEGPAPTPPPGR